MSFGDKPATPHRASLRRAVYDICIGVSFFLGIAGTRTHEWWGGSFVVVTAAMVVLDALIAGEQRELDDVKDELIEIHSDRASMWHQAARKLRDGSCDKNCLCGHWGGDE